MSTIFTAIDCWGCAGDQRGSRALKIDGGRDRMLELFEVTRDGFSDKRQQSESPGGRTMSAVFELGQDREPLDTTAVVETPEHVRFSYQLAGPARRSLAYVIDLLIRAAIVFAILMIAALGGALGSDGIAGASFGVVLVVVFAVEWGYYVLLETLTAGRSIGKRALRLRVVKQGGLPLGFGDSVLRNLLRAADFLPNLYAIGLLVMGFDRCFRRLGDMVAGTLVISEERIRMQQALRITPEPTLAELSHLPERPPLTPGDVEAIELFLRRSGELSAARENELAEMVAPIYARRMGVRYRDAARFLALLYHRATERS